MRYRLIAPTTCNNARAQVLFNRGIKPENFDKYIYASLNDVSSPKAFGEEKMMAAAKMVGRHVQNDSKTIIIVDPDVDGNTASAALLNYLYDFFPEWTKNIKVFFHNGKEHGLNDCVDYIIDNGYQFVLCPDAGSNDAEECAKLQEHGIDILILDHHDLDKENPHALIINNQKGYSNYPNKALSGVGVVWQFCRFFDSLLNTNYAMKYLDLVSIGLTGDMMDIRSIETKALINEGLQNIHNPFIYYMAQKNAFKLGSKITPIGAAFYIVPLLNAIQRSGTLEEKQLVFKSMVQYYAFEQVPSTKRGHKEGDTEILVEQAVRVCTNVKNRQTKIQDSAVAALEKQIEDNNLLNNCKVLILLLDEKSNVPAEVRGLIANKFMAKYQRPCCILTAHNEQTSDKDTYETSYAGSARGCSLAGVDDFKQLCLDSECVEYATGHPNAFGLKIYKRDLQKFINYMNEALKDMSEEPIYYVDYIFQGHEVDESILLEIGRMSSYWGTELDEPFVAIEGLKVTPEMVNIYDKKTKTIKITLRNGISIMKFNADDELCDKLTKNNTGYMEMDIVGECNINEWMGNERGQIFIEDFNIIDSNKYYF